MKLEESSLFYKIDGVAAAVWTEYENKPTLAELTSQFSTEFSGAIEALHADLLQRKLISETQAPAPTQRKEYPPSAQSMSTVFGGIKEFNLEQIETEVLNESIYLDVFAGSDLRLKKNVAPLEGALAKVVQLDGVRFEWQEGRLPEVWAKRESMSPQAGVIAQQVAELMPELVRKDSESGYLAVDYTKMTSYLIEAIKDLHQRVQAQDRRIQELEKSR